MGGGAGAGTTVGTRPRPRRRCWSAAWLVLIVAAAGCNPAPVHVAARRLAAVAPGEIRRIAVLPFSEVGLPARPGSTDSLPEPPGEIVTRAVADAMRRLPDWRIVDDLVVAEAFRQLYGEVRAPTPEEAIAVGGLLHVDAVLRGQVTEFEERVGAEFAAQSPARVVFAVELTRMPSASTVWQAEYAETQRALSENLWNLFGFLRAGAKWVRADELAALGADEVVAEMHDALYGSRRAKSVSR